MTSEQAAQVVTGIDNLVSISQFQALGILLLCGLVVAGCLALIIMEGLK